MLASLFRKNFPLVLVLTPVVAVIYWGFSFYEPAQIISDDHAPLYQAMLELVRTHVWVEYSFSILLICGQAIMLSRLFNRHDILDRETYLPALFYVILMSCLYGLQSFHPFLLFNFFFILAMRSLFQVRRQLDARKQTFLAGMYIGIGSLCYAPGIVVLLHIWLTLLILRPFVWREWILPLIGAGLSYLYLGVFYYLTDDFDSMYQLFNAGEVSYALEYSEFLEFKYALFGIFSLVGIVSISNILKSFRTHSVRFRKLIQVNLALAMVLLSIEGASYFFDYDNYSIAPYAPLLAMLFGYYFFLSWDKIVPKVLYYSTNILILINLYFQIRE